MLCEHHDAVYDSSCMGMVRFKQTKDDTVYVVVDNVSYQWYMVHVEPARVVLHRMCNDTHEPLAVDVQHMDGARAVNGYMDHVMDDILRVYPDYVNDVVRVALTVWRTSRLDGEHVYTRGLLYVVATCVVRGDVRVYHKAREALMATPTGDDVFVAFVEDVMEGRAPLGVAGTDMQRMLLTSVLVPIDACARRVVHHGRAVVETFARHGVPMWDDTQSLVHVLARHADECVASTSALEWLVRNVSHARTHCVERHSVLHVAIRYNQPHTVHMLLREGVDPVRACGSTLFSPLTTAVLYDYDHIATMLIQHYHDGTLHGTYKSTLDTLYKYILEIVIAAYASTPLLEMVIGRAVLYTARDSTLR